LLCAVAFSVVAAHKVDAQPFSPVRSDPSKVGNVPVADVLQRLGAKLENRVTRNQLDSYSRHFDRLDRDGDGRHSTVEYIDSAGYMTPDARRGIFNASDSDQDGFVTKAEYILNRMVTDEAKEIVQGLDENGDGLVTRDEFLRNTRITDATLARPIVDALDVNNDGELRIPESLRVWGAWARIGRKPAEQRIATRQGELGDSDAGTTRDTRQANTGRPGGPSPSSSDTRLGQRPIGGPPTSGSPPSVDEVFERFDGNRDGKLVESEIPEFARQFILPADANEDDAVTKQELERFRGSRRRGRQGRPERPAGDRAASSSGRPDGFSPFSGQGRVRPGQAGLGRLAFSGLEIGKPFPSVKIVDADGKEFSTEQLKGHYAVFVAGCLTCPAFLGSYPGVEAAHRDYASKGVKFYYVYRALAHPENNGIVKPFSLEERLMHVAEARTRLKTRVPWLADNMNNDFKRAIGNTNNSEFVLDPEGRIVHMQMWSNGDRLRAALAEHVGPVAKPTTVAELGIPSFRMRPNTRGAVLPRIEVPGIMVPLKIEPKENGQPFYVKLRAEAEQSVLEKGSGKVYLGFHIDPIHNTHWNNLADPLQFEIKAPSGTKVTPGSGEGPKLEVESDSDPREFLVSLENASPDSPLNLTVHYFACSEDPAWCKSIKQEYSIRLARDEFGGAVFGRSFVPGGPFRGDPVSQGPSQRGSGRPGGGFGGPRPPAARRGPPSAEALFSRFDRNADGKLTEGEVPAMLWQRLSNTDADDDGAITPEEFEKNRNRRPPADPPTGERSGQQKQSSGPQGIEPASANCPACAMGLTAEFVFKRLDVNEDGKIVVEEFEKSPAVRGEAQAREAVGKIDTSGDGVLAWEEFETAYRIRHADCKKTSPEGKEGGNPIAGPDGRGDGNRFSQVFILRSDRNGDGRIDKEEFRGSDFGFDRMDKNGNGFIELDELNELHQRRLADPKTMHQRLQDGDVRRPPQGKRPKEMGKPSESRKRPTEIPSSR
jgi:Ca2+-binding EF-hand superfamily protein